MPKTPDDSERAAAGRLPADPEADTETMRVPGIAPTLGDLFPAALDRALRRQTGQDPSIPVRWPTLAARLGGGRWPGLRPGLHVFAGIPGSGKTQLALQLALHAAQKDTPALYVALEADDDEIFARCLGIESGVPWSQILLGQRDDIAHLYARYAPALVTLPLHVRYPSESGWPIETLTEDVLKLRAQYPTPTKGAKPLLVVLDYLQRVNADPAKPHQDLREHIGQVTRTCKRVSDLYDAGVIVVSSVAREHYFALTGRKRDGSENTDEPLGTGNASRFLSIGKESGEIEYDANSLIVLTQVWKHDTLSDDTVCWLALPKVRHGRAGLWVELRFNGNTFEEPAAGVPVPGAPTR